MFRRNLFFLFFLLGSFHLSCGSPSSSLSLLKKDWKLWGELEEGYYVFGLSSLRPCSTKQTLSLNIDEPLQQWLKLRLKGCTVAKHMAAETVYAPLRINQKLQVFIDKEVDLVLVEKILETTNLNQIDLKTQPLEKGRYLIEIESSAPRPLLSSKEVTSTLALLPTGKRFQNAVCIIQKFILN